MENFVNDIIVEFLYFEYENVSYTRYILYIIREQMKYFILYRSIELGKIIFLPGNSNVEWYLMQIENVNIILNK